MHAWIVPAINMLAAALLAVIAHAVKVPKDHERAQLLTTLAESAAAVCLNIYPAAEWPKLLAAVVQMVQSEATVPTSNMKAIENAATAALAKLGKSSATAPVSVRP